MGTVSAVNYQATSNAYREDPSGGKAFGNVKHVELDSTYTLVAYQAADGDISAVIGTKVDVNLHTWGTPVTLAGSFVIQELIKLSSTKALVTMRETVGGYISSAVISFTAPSTVAIASAVNSTLDAVDESIKACLINTDKVIVAYKDTSDSYPKVAVISISGTTPSYGSPTNCKAAATTNADSISICKVTTTTFHVTYDNGTYVYSHIMSFDGNATITANTEYSTGSLFRHCSCVTFDSTRIIVTCWSSASVSMIVVSFSGTTISATTGNNGGYFTEFKYTTTILVDANKVMAIGYYVAGGYPTIFKGIVSGTSISVSSSFSGNLNYGGAYPSTFQIVDSTHLSIATYGGSGTAIYGVLTLYNGNASISNNYSATYVTECDAGKELSISMITASGTNNIYVGGTDYDKYVLQVAYSSSSNTNATTTEFGRGILKLANCPLILTAGQKLYITGIGTVSFFGVEETL